MKQASVTITVVLCVLLVGLTGREGEVRPEESKSSKVVKIKAKRFKFVPSKISMAAGTSIEIVLTSQDVTHGFRIVGTDTNVQIPARGRGNVKVTFSAQKPGQYRFECSRNCGAGHSSMRGVIRVADAPGSSPGPGFQE